MCGLALLQPPTSLETRRLDLPSFIDEHLVLHEGFTSTQVHIEQREPVLDQSRGLPSPKRSSAWPVTSDQTKTRDEYSDYPDTTPAKSTARLVREDGVPPSESNCLCATTEITRRIEKRAVGPTAVAAELDPSLLLHAECWT